MNGDRDSSWWVFVAALIVLYLLLGYGIGIHRLPDLLTVATLFAARRLSGAGGAAAGLLIGLLADGVAMTGFGASAVTKSIIGFLGARSRELFVGDSFFFLSIYLFVGKWLHDVIFGFFAGAEARGSLVSRMVADAPLAALYAMAAGLVALILYRMIGRSR